MGNESDKRRPDSQEFEDFGMNYCWRASRLTLGDSRRLAYVSNHLGRPIIQIIREAVQACMTALIDEMSNRVATPHAFSECLQFSEHHL